MDGVGTPIIGRPRPIPGHDTPNPANNTYTLNYEEPENPTEELRKLLEESGKVLEAPLHRPDSVLARSEYRKVENLPDFLANFTNDKNDYYYDIDERILEIPSETDKHEQELHKHMKEMGEAYRKLLSQIGIQIP